jgi:hypothetical protein
MAQQNEPLHEPTEAVDMEQFKETPYYQSLGIEGLKQQLGGYQADDAQLRAQAESMYKPTYDAEIEALRQQLAGQVQGYEGQISGMGAVYDRQRRSTDQAYDESAAQLNNTLTKRGLGRSSLVSTQGTYLENQRNQALGDIDRDEAQAINAINERIALLTDQAAQSERTMAGNYARQLEQRVNELREKNRTASVSLQLQIAALQQQGYEAYQKWLLDSRAQELKEREFDIKYGAKASGGSSGGSKKSAAAAKSEPKNTPSAGSTMASLMEKAKQLIGNLAMSHKKKAASDREKEFAVKLK